MLCALCLCLRCENVTAMSRMVYNCFSSVFVATYLIDHFCLTKNQKEEEKVPWRRAGDIYTRDFFDRSNGLNSFFDNLEVRFHAKKKAEKSAQSRLKMKIERLAKYWLSRSGR